MKNLLCSISCLAVCLLIIAGCAASGQVTPTPPWVGTWSWPVSAGSTSTNGYVLSVAVVASGTTSCPTTNGNAYKQVATISSNGNSYADSAETPGSLICGIVQETLGSGTTEQFSQPSVASNNGVPFQVPAGTTPPGTPNINTTTALLAPTPTVQKQLASLERPGQLSIR